MAISITQNDFEGIGIIATHCDNRKLNIAINRAILFDLKPLLCELFFDVNDNWDDVNGIWFDLIEPLEFEGCSGKKKSHQGLKNVLSYYSYAKYVFANDGNDTPNGIYTLVFQKFNDGWKIISDHTN